MPGRRKGQGWQQAVAGRDAIIAGRDQFIINVGTAGSGERVVPGLLPRNVPGFTGRENELDRLAALAGGESVVVTVIGGTAGVGKTALAVHAAYQLLPQFQDGQLYADLRGYTEGQTPAEPSEILEAFLRRLGVAAEDIPARVEERSGLLRDLLASRRVLVLLDNTQSEAQVRPLLPGAGRSLVLITSRSLLPGLEADERISLDVLPEERADELLAAMIGSARAAAEQEALERVRELCGSLPLALRIAGQTLAVHPAWPVARLERMLADEQDRLKQLEAGDLRVRAALGASYQQLPEDDARMFRMLGLHPGPDFGVLAASALAGTEPEHAGRVLDRLVETSMVTEHGSRRFGMHDLMRLFARTICYDLDDRATRDAAEVRLVTRYALLAWFLDSCLDPQRRSAAAHAAEQVGISPLPSQRQARTIFETERPSLVAVAGLARQRGLDDQVQELSGSMQRSLTLLRYLDDLLTLWKAALAAARHAGDTAAEGSALNNLGEAYRESRRFKEAVDCGERALVIFRKVGDRQGEGAALNNLGEAYRELRRFEEAVGRYKQALVIFRKVGDRHGESKVLVNLGNSYLELHQLEEAVSSYQESLVVLREVGDRHGEGIIVNNLGEAYRLLRRFEEAVDCGEQALVIFREVGDRHREGWALANLGEADRESQRFEEAVSRYQESLVVLREVGDRHGEGRTLGMLGNAYLDLRQHDRAAACWRDAAAAMRDARDYEQAEHVEKLTAHLEEFVAHLEESTANTRPRRRRWRRN